MSYLKYFSETLRKMDFTQNGPELYGLLVGFMLFFHLVFTVATSVLKNKFNMLDYGRRVNFASRFGSFIFWILSSIFWHFLFLFFCYWLNQRITAIVFAVSIVCLAIPILVFDSDLYENPLIYKSNPTIVAFAIVAACFIYDLVCMVFIKELRDLQFVIHHAVCILGMYWAGYHGAFSLFAVIRLTEELSTPFLHVRWMLLNSNRKKSSAFVVISKLFFVMFTACRIVPIIPYWMKYFDCIGSKE